MFVELSLQVINISFNLIGTYNTFDTSAFTLKMNSNGVVSGMKFYRYNEHMTFSY